MNVKTQEIYSEVYSILNMLGNNYISKLPSGLFKIIEEEKLDSYNPQFLNMESLNQQNIKRETLAMIALFHLNYWCVSAEEKNKLRTIFKKNEEKHQAEIYEKYNPDNLFENRKQEVIQLKNTEEQESKELIEYKEIKFYKKILNKIISFFKKKGKF